jgi:hypothetical protein
MIILQGFEQGGSLLILWQRASAVGVDALSFSCGLMCAHQPAVVYVRLCNNSIRQWLCVGLLE